VELFTLQNLGSLGVLIFLQAVLGFDNLLYISLESQRAPAELRKRVRFWGILIAVGLRVVLLFVIMSMLDAFSTPFFAIRWVGVLEGEFNFSTLVFMSGGAFLMYTAVKEISHLLAIEHLDEAAERSSKSALRVVLTIVSMNLIFSFDSILSALAITKVFAILALAIVASGILMLLLADRVSAFIERNRKYEVLGLFILLIVGVVLLGDGGHEAHLSFFGFSVEPMSKATFYFALFVLVVVDILQSRYQDKLATERRRTQGGAPA
jgi:predicted tellurium resistance membrane protein TerC